MKLKRVWKLLSLFTTLILCFHLNAAENEESRNSSAVEIDINEITAQCEEHYSDEKIPDEDERKPMIDKCIDEKIDKLKKFADEQG